MLKKISIALAAAAALSANIANAGQLDSSAFTVQATVAGACTTVTPLSVFNFGTLIGTSGNADSQMNVSVTCSNTLPYNLAISYGQSGSFNRAMKNGTNTLTYNLYTDSGRTNVLGDTTFNAAGWIGGTGSGATQNLTVYGRVPIQTSPVAGVYTDSLIASVIW